MFQAIVLAALSAVLVYFYGFRLARTPWTGLRDRIRLVMAGLRLEHGELVLDSRDTRLQGEIESHLKAAQTIAAKAEAEDRDFTAEERAAVTKALEDARAIKRRMDEAKGDKSLLAELNALGRPIGETAKGAGTVTDPKVKDLSERVLGHGGFKSWMDTVGRAASTSNEGRVGDSPIVPFKGLKDIISGGVDAQGGALVETQWLGLLDFGRFNRPLTLADLVTRGQTSSDAVKFARQLAQTNNAAPAAEAAGVEPFEVGAGQVEGAKPQSNFTVETATAEVVTIAHWLPATKRALSDAGQIRTLIDNFLRYGLEEELEDQMAAGDGTGENFTGLLNTSGTQAQAWDTNLLVTTRKAKTKVRTVGKTNATAYVLNPEDNERIDLLRTEEGGANTGSFMFGSPAGNQVQTLWGLPRVECEAVPAGTGLVGNFRMAVLWDREEAGISVSDSHSNFFVRNLVAILAELRAAFGVIRPAAFVEIDLTA